MPNGTMDDLQYYLILQLAIFRYFQTLDIYFMQEFVCK
jgi:hypothetical protein